MGAGDLAAAAGGAARTELGEWMLRAQRQASDAASNGNDFFKAFLFQRKGASQR